MPKVRASRTIPQPQISFPLRLADMQAFIPDQAAAQLALGLLFIQVIEDDISIYARPNDLGFNIWLGHALRPPQGERLTLKEWCAIWYAAYQDGRESDLSR
jgi:hypothetical protein